MKKLLLLIVFLPKFAFGDMKPLSQIHMSDTSESTVLYILYRCAALQYGWSGLMNNRKDQGSQNMKKIAEKLALDFQRGAVRFIENKKLDISMEQIRENTELVMNNYDQIWKLNYSKTGQNIGPMTLEDTEICNQYYSLLSPE